MRATKDTMRENDGHLLAGAWWVTLKSLDLYNLSSIMSNFRTYPLFTADYGIVVGVFCMIGRFWMTYAMSSGQQYVFEVFPTSLRAQGNALATVFSLASQFFSPYVAYSVRVDTSIICNICYAVVKYPHVKIADSLSKTRKLVFLLHFRKSRRRLATEQE